MLVRNTSLCDACCCPKSAVATIAEMRQCSVVPTTCRIQVGPCMSFAIYRRERRNPTPPVGFPGMGLTTPATRGGGAPPVARRPLLGLPVSNATAPELTSCVRGVAGARACEQRTETFCPSRGGIELAGERMGRRPRIESVDPALGSAARPRRMLAWPEACNAAVPPVDAWTSRPCLGADLVAEGCTRCNICAASMTGTFGESCRRPDLLAGACRMTFPFPFKGRSRLPPFLWGVVPRDRGQSSATSLRDPADSDRASGCPESLLLSVGEVKCVRSEMPTPRAAILLSWRASFKRASMAADSGTYTGTSGCCIPGTSACCSALRLCTVAASKACRA